MLLDSISKNLLSSAEPAITKLRSWCFFVFIIFNSPLIDKLFSPLVFNDSIENALKKLAEATQATPLIYYLIGGACVYFLIPYINYYLCITINKIELSSARNLIAVSENISRKSNEEIKTLIAERFDELELTAKTTLTEINGIIIYLETLTITVFIYLYFYIVFQLDFLFLPITLITWALIAFFSVRKITLNYLESILPYKVLSGRYNSAFETKDNSIET